MNSMGKPEKVERLLYEVNKGIATHSGEFLIGIIEADDESYCELMEFAGALINKSTYVLRDEKSVILSIALVWRSCKRFLLSPLFNSRFI